MPHSGRIYQQLIPDLQRHKVPETGSTAGHMAVFCNRRRAAGRCGTVRGAPRADLRA